MTLVGSYAWRYLKKKRRMTLRSSCFVSAKSQVLCQPCNCYCFINLGMENRWGEGNPKADLIACSYISVMQLLLFIGKKTMSKND